MSGFQYEGEKPLKCLGFFSGGASSMEAIAQSPDYGEKYVFVGAVTNSSEEEAEKGYRIARRLGLEPCFINPNKYSSRRKYWEEITQEVEDLDADVIVLSGFLHKYSIISDPFLTEYENRILNVHPADLSILCYPPSGWLYEDLGCKEMKKYLENARDFPYGEAKKFIDFAGWKRRYVGDDAVYDAVLFGEEEVCSTIHSVTESLDGGPILVQSERIEVDREYVEKMLKRRALSRVVDYAHELQERMKTECDGPAFCKALELLANGRLTIGDDYVKLDEGTLPYGGYQLEQGRRK